ncbi:MAG: hypothetical protein JEZ07_07765 [Phycisphaerae bacterium]|nr:hypothetical protein [Phycisphaerae bacterium]
MAWAISLLVIALLLVILEIFIPSAGLIGIMAAGFAAAAIYLAFKENPKVGYAFLTITIVSTPIVFIAGLHYFPKTPIGKRLILKPNTETAKHRGIDGVSDEDFSVLVGKTGIAKSNLMPSGIIEIDDIRYSAVCQGTVIDAESEIVVVGLEGNSIIVDLKEV